MSGGTSQKSQVRGAEEAKEEAWELQMDDI